MKNISVQPEEPEDYNPDTDYLAATTRAFKELRAGSAARFPRKRLYGRGCAKCAIRCGLAKCQRKCWMESKCFCPE
ncbi:MAG: hypothetical protein AMXMBFR84_37500 [Candidatus Hydrogenedentota bacterium]